MPTDIKEYIEREARGPVQEERFDGSLAEILTPNHDRVQPEIIEQNPVDQAPNFVAAILSEQARSITDEWRLDSASGTYTAHELEAYFAGRIDQHNSVIEAVAAAYPALRESLPEQLDFSAVKQQLQQENNRQVDASLGIGGYAV